ncbi:cysteine synthase A [Francisella philomiragia]|uniref:cysteine synthase n=1 Tax=Francisella philomiragia subsp. philomiragia (strain ATCC 25017 / CCUG 19701 / FSC 153 / O\|nr:cysteine synthase A [Francisella philomiragia]AJI46810.1 cysteine synthase A [Francisella philomiragia]AJI48940.1 cysteine synthase A [Francisella philomiragia]MBK2019719.1 cysteine synthase A [Francisella philomiragia]MBK2029827.1 cysteine synthase A [Francisella philomiragia]MBK2263763.1 cysteine synthase A [Francisella philomiragia]
MNICNDFTETIGKTPMVRLCKIEELFGLKVKLVAKLEFFNPLSSVKDRVALNLIESAEKAGNIKPGVTTLIEPTSGNTGIGLSFIAAAKGYDLIITMPESVSVERRKLIQHFGAKLILTPAAEGMAGSIAKANDLLKELNDGVILGQFTNPANPQAHRNTTALEVWQDTDGEVDILVAGVGTGGTITGIAEVLKQKKTTIKIVAVEPKSSPVLSGGKPGSHKIQGIGAGFIPEILNTSIIDDIVTVSDVDALDYARLVAHKEGVPAGISSGAALKAAIEIAQRTESENKMIVVVFASSAERYLSTALFAKD